MPQPWPWVKVMERSSSTFPQTHIFFVPNIKGLAQTVLMWEGKVFADADPAETDWKHKVTPERGDLINVKFDLLLMSNLICCNSCRKVGSHIVYVLLSKILIISFWRKHACTAREIHMGQASTNFHSLPPTCLTIYLIMLKIKCTSKV